MLTSEIIYSLEARMSGRVRVFRTEPWERRIPPRFDTAAPAALALIDLTAALYRLHLDGGHPSSAQTTAWLRAFRKATYAGRTRTRPYVGRSAGIGESERLRVTAQGALWYAAALVDMRNAHLRD